MQTIIASKNTTTIDQTNKYFPWKTYFRRGCTMQTNTNNSSQVSCQSQDVRSHKIVCALSAMLFALPICSASLSQAASFDGNLKSVSITDAAGTNTPPTAVINYSKDGNTINFDATGSSDPDGNIASYSWNFGDGTTGEGATITHQLLSQPSDITLTVIDNKGAAALTHVMIGSYAFSDDFSADTSSNYSVDYPWTAGGTGQLSYDTQGQRLYVQAGDNMSVRFAQNVTSSATGSFGMDFHPTVMYPSAGTISILLRQDDNNFYKITNNGGGQPVGVFKYVGGVQTEQTAFKSVYAQNNDYHIAVNFSANQTVVEAFGEVISISTDKSPISVSKFQVVTQQQDAYYDNITYTTSN